MYINENRDYACWRASRETRNYNRWMDAGEKLWEFLWRWRIAFLLIAALALFHFGAQFAQQFHGR